MKVNARSMNEATTSTVATVIMRLMRALRIPGRDPDLLIDGAPAVVATNHTCDVGAAAAVVSAGIGGHKSAKGKNGGNAGEKELGFHGDVWCLSL